MSVRGRGPVFLCMSGARFSLALGASYLLRRVGVGGRDLEEVEFFSSRRRRRCSFGTCWRGPVTRPISESGVQ